MEKTSVRIGKDTLRKLQKMKTHPRETYEDVIKRLIEKWKSTQ
jgi:predicted CopG family antitoxin